MAEPVPKHVRSIWPPLLLLALSVGFVIWSQRYGAVPRLMPTIAGSATALLCLIDLLSRFENAVGRALRLALGADFRNREMSHNPSAGREAAQIAWMIACIVLMLSIGILPAVPIFILAYMRFVGRRSWPQAGWSALAVLGFVMLVFELMLDYALYRGVLFDPRGLNAW